MSDLPDKDLLRVDEVATYFSITEKTVYLWVEQKKLEGRRLARNVLRITRKSVLSCKFGPPD